jgi:hypothetical protein
MSTVQPDGSANRFCGRLALANRSTLSSSWARVGLGSALTGDATSHDASMGTACNGVSCCGGSWSIGKAPSMRTTSDPAASVLLVTSVTAASVLLTTSAAAVSVLLVTASAAAAAPLVSIARASNGVASLQRWTTKRCSSSKAAVVKTLAQFAAGHRTTLA